MEIKPKQTVQSLNRTFQIIELLSLYPHGLPLVEICSQTGLAKGTASRLLAALIQNSYAFQDPTSKKYGLTMRLFEIGSRVVGGTNILSISKPYLEDLSRACNGTVHLVSRVNDNVVYLYKEETTSSIVRMASCVGLQNPMYCVGVGKAILAFLPDEEIQSIWHRCQPVRFTQNTITTYERLRSEIEEIRRLGYAIDNEEHELDVKCVAVPIYDINHVPIAAISISEHSKKMTDERIQEYIPLLLNTAKKIGNYYGAK